MHICLFISQTHPKKNLNENIGGIASQILQLLQSFEKIKDLNISIITQYTEYKPISNRVHIYEIHKFENFIIDTFYYLLKSFYQILKIHKKKPIDVLNIHQNSVFIIIPILIRLLFKIPILMKIPIDFSSFITTASLNEKISVKLDRFAWFKIFIRFLLGKINFIRPINNLMIKQLKEMGYPTENILRVPNGINTRDFISIKKDNQQKTHFGFVGRLTKFKNISFLIKSFNEYLNLYPKDKLYIYGTGPQRDYISNFISDKNLKGRIILCGYENDKEKIYRNLDVLIDPAFAQGISNANLEAMCTDTFLIASNVPGNKDLIKDRVTGLLFDPKNKKDLLNKLIIFKKEKELVRTILNKAKNEIISKYDTDIITKKIFEFLKKKTS